MAPRKNPRPKTPAIELVSRRLQADGDCWIFTGYTDNRGYGRCGHGLVHRVTYRHYIGEIPVGLELDHLCRRPACCNPWHLEPVTHAENVRRGQAGWNLDNRCKHGHDLSDPNNVYVHTKGSRGRKCKPCALRNSRLAYEKKKEQAA